MGKNSNTAEIKIFETICLWSDLLGYGKAFYESNWDLHEKASANNLDRIKSLEQYLKYCPVPIAEKILFLNDGIIRNVDIYTTGSYVEIYLMWLEHSIRQFHQIKYQDMENGYPGIRGVLTFGQRAHYTSEITKMSDLVKLIDPQKSDEIIIYSPNEFQMNTAFSKAYIMENDGSRGGLEGPNLYVDEFFIVNFLEIINKSPLQEMIKEISNDDNDKVDKNNIEKHMVKFYGYLIEEFDKVELIFKVNIEGYVFDFLKIIFDLKIVNYKKEACNIETRLFKVTNLWSAEFGPMFKNI